MDVKKTKKLSSWCGSREVGLSAYVICGASALNQRIHKLFHFVHVEFYSLPYPSPYIRYPEVRYQVVVTMQRLTVQRHIGSSSSLV